MRSVKKALHIFFILAFFMGLPTLAFAVDTYEIYTYASGDFLASIFNGMKMLIDGGHLASLVKVMLLIGLIIGVLAPVMGFLGRGHGQTATGQIFGAESFLALVKVALFAGIAVYLLMLPRANMAIIDRADPSQTQVITDVPLVNVFVAHISSRIGDAIGAEIEDVLVPVDAVRFRKNGVAIGAKYLNEILDIEPPAAPVEYGATNNVSINMVLGEYFERCVFPNFAFIRGTDSEEAIGLRFLHQSPIILDDIPNIGRVFRDPNIFFNVNFDESTPVTCANAPEQINSYWDGIFPGWLKQVNYRFLGGNPDDPGYFTTTQELFERYFPNSIGSFRDQIKQIAVLNSVRYALISYAAKHGDYNVKDVLLTQKTGSAWIEAGRLFNKIVQTVRMLIEALVYGLSIFLPVFFVIGGIGAIVTFAKINLWLQMWVPFYVILNAFADWQFARVIQDALYNREIDSSFYGMSFATVEAIRSHANLILGYIGAFTWSIPPLAWGLIKGGEYAMTHAVSAISSGSGGQTVANRVGAEVGGAGNVTMGNRSMGNTGFMSSTHVGSQASMIQGLSASSAMGKIVGTTGSATSAVEGMGSSQAVDIAKGIGRAGVYGGNLPKAMSVAGVGEQRAVADMETFKSASSPHGGVEAFQSAISTKDYTKVGTMLGDYADRKGISLGQASHQVGSLMGTRELVGTHAFENAMGVVGSRGLEFTETQKTLNEAGKMEQMYRIANQLGFTSNREDFAGMFKGHLAHHAEETLTVPNAGVAEKLNQMAGEQGLGVTFSSGDRVRMAWKDGEDGNPQVSLFRGEAGGSREALDLSKSASGIQNWSGQESQLKNLVSASGVIGIGQPGIFNARTFAGLLKASGAGGVASSLAKDIGKGRQVSLESATLDPQSGKLTAFQLRRGGSNTVEDYSRTQTGWESRTTALTSEESGLRRHTGAIDVKHDEKYSVQDHMNKRKGGGEEITMVTPQGVTSGYLSYDKNVGGPVLVSGNVRYGVGKEIVTAGPDGSLLFQDVKVDPKTNQVVAGSERSLMVSEMQMVSPHDNRAYKVQMFTDAKTGKQLAIEGQSGTFWQRTQYEGDMHIAEYRGYEQRGDVLSTMAERAIPGAGRYVGDIIKGIGEAGQVFDRFKSTNLKPGSGASTTTGTGRELNQQKREWGEYFKRQGWKPVE